MTYRVFVSHSSHDKKLAEWIKGQTGSGIELWLAEHDPKPGSVLSKKIQGELDRCHAMVVIVTESGQATSFVHQEIGWALKAGTIVIPLVQVGIPSTELAMLEGAEYIPFDFGNAEDGRMLVSSGSFW